LGRFPAPQNVDPSTLRPIGQMHSQIAVAFASDRSVPSALREARDHTAAIQSLIAERVGGAYALDFAPWGQPLQALVEVCGAALGLKVESAAKDNDTESGDAVRPAVVGEIRSRDDAVRMLELVCNYLERNEPSNPAPLFIRRAQRLIKK